MKPAPRILPDLPPEQNPLAGKLAAYEAELDQIWGESRARGGWRKHEPFDKVRDAKLVHRLKWLLVRRNMARRGDDRDVLIHVLNPREPWRCRAIPMGSPPEGAPPADPLNPESPLLAWRPPAATVLAFELRIPLEHAEAALSRAVPESFRSDDGIRLWCRTIHDSIGRAMAAAGRPDNVVLLEQPNETPSIVPDDPER